MTSKTIKNSVSGNGIVYLVINGSWAGTVMNGFPITVTLNSGDTYGYDARPGLNSSFVKACDTISCVPNATQQWSNINLADFGDAVFYFSDSTTPPPATTVRKELVTNLTTDESLIKAALFITGGVSAYDYTFISKYTEGNNTVFVFDVKQDPTRQPYVDLGAGAGLANFVAANWKSIAYLLAVLGVVAIVWMWRDASTKASEVAAKLSDNIKSEIDKTLADPYLTSAQKAAILEDILNQNKGKPPVDWTAIAAIIAVAIIIVALLQSGLLGGKK